LATLADVLIVDRFTRRVIGGLRDSCVRLERRFVPSSIRIMGTLSIETEGGESGLLL
jgi:hypothetical protein